MLALASPFPSFAPYSRLNSSYADKFPHNWYPIVDQIPVIYIVILSQAKLLGNLTFYSGIYPYSLYMGVPHPSPQAVLLTVFSRN